MSADFVISLPASSANLGPAFDSAALALSLRLRVRAREAPRFRIEAEGEDAAICGGLDDNLLIQTYHEGLTSVGRLAHPLHLEIKNEIPIGKGCGSSAAARLAGLALANHFGHLGWSGERICREAGEREGHWDNVAACWYGGLALVHGSGEAVRLTALAPARKWPLLLAIPPTRLPTADARKVLPVMCTLADAVNNVQSSMALMMAFSQGRTDLLQLGLADRLHQPYRAALCPLLPALQPLGGSAAVAGVALSGAGPSVLIFVSSDGERAAAKAAVERAVRDARLSALIAEITIDLRGAVPGCG